MSGTTTLLCWVLKSPIDEAFPLDIESNKLWGHVKDAIKEKNKNEFADIDANTLKLWKAVVPFSPRSILESESFLKDVTAREPLDPIGSLSTDLKDPLPDKYINIIFVQRPTRLVPTMSPSNSDSSLSLDKTWARRPNTVETIYLILNSERLVQVRGTPGSGKTILLKLLRNYISKVDREAVVHIVSSWLKETPVTTLASRLSARLPGVATEHQGVDARMEKTYILFDNGQDTFWDTEIWEIFFKDHQQRRNGYRIILFCSYGSASTQIVDYDHGTPGVVRPSVNRGKCDLTC